LIKYFLFISLFLVLLFSEPFEDYKINKFYEPIKNNDLSISIDGVLNEDEWKNTAVITDFIQAEPIYGNPATKATEVRVLYDNQFIYIAAYLFDDKKNIKTKQGSYDDWFGAFEKNADYFIVEIDSRHNHKSSYGFAVNSSGVQCDYQLIDDGANINDDWNAQWYSATSINEKGWIIEYKIPWKILRYHSDDTMGINFSRFIYSNNEEVYWILLPIELTGIVSHYGHLNDLKVPNQKSLMIQPYMLYGFTDFDVKYYQYGIMGDLDFEQEPVWYDYRKKRDSFGINFVYLPNNHSSLHYSFNPDFGQVEQDPSEINLTGYEIYYDEKRPFFTSDKSVFDTPIDIFYSRRIGGNIFFNNHNYETKIDYAAKYTGASNNGFLYGILLSESSIDVNNILDNTNIRTAVTRLRKDVINQTSYIGFMHTQYEDFRNFSDVFSIDGLITLLNNKFKFDGQVVSTNLNSLDRKMGHSYEISYTNKISNPKLGFLHDNVFDTWINYEKYDKLFDINHIGYLRRNDFEKIHYGFALSRQIIDGYIKNYSFDIQNINSKNIDGIIIKNDISFNLRTYYVNGISLQFNYIKSLSHYDDWLKLSDYDVERDLIVVKKPESDNIKLTFSTDPLNQWSLIYSLEYFSNTINDYGGGYSLNILYEPVDWIFIDIGYELDSYYDKYHFLKIQPYTNIPDPEFDNIIRITPIEDYYFSNSKIFERGISILLSSYISNNFSIKAYSRYFTYNNDYPNQYNYLDENYQYPYGLTDPITNEQKESDMLLYSSKFTSFEFNWIFEYKLNREVNFYFIYSFFKGISGKNFNDFNNFMQYSSNADDGTKFEYYYDQSFFIKLDFILK